MYDGSQMTSDPRQVPTLPVLCDIELETGRTACVTVFLSITAASHAGAETLEEFSSLDRFLTAHVLGTCRMGTSAADSVSDADGFSHEVPNLAFADGSLVPSSGSGDSPCLTITALALRTADRLLERASRRD